MTIIIDKLKLSYVAVPKVACTSLKTLFFEIENGFAFQPFSINGRMRWIHDFYRSVPFSELRHAAMENHDRVCVVRDPVARLLSCYANRVVHHKELSREKALKPLRRAALPFDPDLTTFVNNLDAYCDAVPSIAHHAAPMAVYLGDRVDYYSRIYSMTELGAMTDDISAKAGRPMALEHLQKGGPKIGRDALSSADLAFLERYYQIDYDLYGRFL